MKALGAQTGAGQVPDLLGAGSDNPFVLTRAEAVPNLPAVLVVATDGATRGGQDSSHPPINLGERGRTRRAQSVRRKK